jgi:cerevisin
VDDVVEDNDGHGTHCAGTIASSEYGVAKFAYVVAVKVLRSNGSSSISDVIPGVVYAAESAARKVALVATELKATGKTKHKCSITNVFRWWQIPYS